MSIANSGSVGRGKTMNNKKNNKMYRTAALKTLFGELVSARMNCVFFDTTNKVIRLTKPISVIELYSLTMDKFEEMEYMVYAIPMIAVTKHYIELINWWSIEDASKNMISEGSWKELGNIYSRTLTIGTMNEH